MRLLLIVLAGTLALPLMASVLVLRGPASVSHAADGDPAVIATIRTGWGGHTPYGVAVNPNTNRIYVTNHNASTVSVIDGASNTVPSLLKQSGTPGVIVGVGGWRPVRATSKG